MGTGGGDLTVLLYPLTTILPSSKNVMKEFSKIICEYVNVRFFHEQKPGWLVVIVGGFVCEVAKLKKS